MMRNIRKKKSRGGGTTRFGAPSRHHLSPSKNLWARANALLPTKKAESEKLLDQSQKIPDIGTVSLKPRESITLDEGFDTSTACPERL
jgi:hypothetical protein